MVRLRRVRLGLTARAQVGRKHSVMMRTQPLVHARGVPGRTRTDVAGVHLGVGVAQDGGE